MEKEFNLSDRILIGKYYGSEIIHTNHVKEAVRRILEILDTHLSPQRKKEKILKILGNKLI